MKIIVLNGSPKGDVSVTMQYVHYIQKKFPQHNLKIINIAQNIKQIEKDKTVFDSIISEIQSSDGVLWAFPLYIFAVASQYKRFIEMIFEQNAATAFKSKYAGIIATSVKLYDHTAVNYINAICDDLQMNYVDYFSSHMQDLKKEEIRNQLVLFARNFFDAIESNQGTLLNYSPISYQPIRYESVSDFKKLDIRGKKAVIITDSMENKNLIEMINCFRNSFTQSIELINLQDIDIKGGCLGCLRCGYNYECIYTGKDGFIDFYNEKILNSDIIILAGTIKDRYLSSTWKRYFDRAFYNTHTPMLSGKQVGFLISGPLKQVPNLTQMMDIFFQYQYAHLVGFATDEYQSSQKIDEQVYTLAGRLNQLSMQDFRKPNTYLGVGGWKILRDEVWGDLRFPFLADHKAYQRLNVYRDFPQRDWKMRFRNFILICLTRSAKIQKEIYHNQIKGNMIKELKRIVDDPTL